MSLSPLIPIAGPAIASLAAKSIEQLSDGLSFADVLRQVVGQSGESPSAQAASASKAAGESGLLNLRDSAFAALQKLKSFALSRLSSAGVDTSRPIRVHVDAFDRVTVQDDHPDRAKIQRLLETDQKLMDAFEQLAERLRDVAAQRGELTSEHMVVLSHDQRAQ